MEKKLSIEEIIAILKTVPEQNAFDEKKDFNFGQTQDKKSEIIKDIAAIANATTNSPGYIFYGVDSKKPNPLLDKEINLSDKDANIQQLVKDKVEPQLSFQCYDVTHDKGKVGVIRIGPSVRKPHIIKKNYGKLREGQILIRKGSSTNGISFQDLLDIFYDPKNPYFLRSSINLYANILQSGNRIISSLKDDIDKINEEARRTIGLP